MKVDENALNSNDIKDIKGALKNLEVLIPTKHANAGFGVTDEGVVAHADVLSNGHPTKNIENVIEVADVIEGNAIHNTECLMAKNNEGNKFAKKPTIPSSWSQQGNTSIEKRGQGVDINPMRASSEYRTRSTTKVILK